MHHTNAAYAAGCVVVCLECWQNMSTINSEIEASGFCKYNCVRPLACILDPPSISGLAYISTSTLQWSDGNTSLNEQCTNVCKLLTYAKHLALKLLISVCFVLCMLLFTFILLFGWAHPTRKHVDLLKTCFVFETWLLFQFVVNIWMDRADFCERVTTKYWMGLDLPMDWETLWILDLEIFYLILLHKTPYMFIQLSSFGGQNINKRVLVCVFWLCNSN